MPRTIRFHLDENCARSIVQGLRREGIDVSFAVDVGLGGATDEEQLEFARAEGRVLFAQDADLVTLHRSGVTHHGIVYCPKDRRTVGEILRGLILLWEVYEDTELVGRLEYLPKDRG